MFFYTMVKKEKHLMFFSITGKKRKMPMFFSTTQMWMQYSPIHYHKYESLYNVTISSFNDSVS